MQHLPIFGDMKATILSACFLLCLKTGIGAPASIGFRSVTFLDGSELIISNKQVTEKVQAWLSNKGVTSLDTRKLGAVTPTFFLITYDEGRSIVDRYPVHVAYGHKPDREVGVLDENEVMELFSLLGIPRIWLLREGLPSKTTDQIREFDPGFRGGAPRDLNP